MQKIRTYNQLTLEGEPLPGPSAVIRIADTQEMVSPHFDAQDTNLRSSYTFIFKGSDATDGQLTQLLDVASANAAVPNLIVQCMMGVGRSHAVVAAIVKIRGGDNSAILRQGTYNRKLYSRLLVAAGLPAPVEKLVSIVIPSCNVECLRAFILCMRRQRYENWELVVMTDGPNTEVYDEACSSGDSRVRVYMTTDHKGWWGHPHRQNGMDLALGDFIGNSNDDNYLTPGYIEQMVYAIENNTADVAVCDCVHSYGGWNVWPACKDLTCWIARSETVRKIKWDKFDLYGEWNWLDKLKAATNWPVVHIPRPLVVHN